MQSTRWVTDVPKHDGSEREAKAVSVVSVEGMAGPRDGRGAPRRAAGRLS
jgi:hypothetical protein